MSKRKLVSKLRAIRRSQLLSGLDVNEEEELLTNKSIGYANKKMIPFPKLETGLKITYKTFQTNASRSTSERC